MRFGRDKRGMIAMKKCARRTANTGDTSSSVRILSRPGSVSWRMKNLFCVLLFVLLAGCAYTAVYLEDEPQELLLVYEPEEMLDTLPFIEYEPAPPLVHNAPEISPLGRQVAADFLHDFWTLFPVSAGWFCLETERFFMRHSSRWEWVESDGTSMFYWGGVMVHRENWSFVDYDGKIYDGAGREITGVPFILEYVSPFFPNVAWRFSLFDFCESGIPDIIITFLPIEPCFEGCLQGFVGETIFYRFIDGAYRKFGTLPHWSYEFFENEYGEIVILYNNVMCGVFGYYFLRITDNEIYTENIFTPAEHTQEWWEHHSWERFSQDPNPTMFYTGMPLMRIPPLADLANEIREEFQRSLTAVVNANANEIQNPTPPQSEQQAAILALEEFLYLRHTIFGHWIELIPESWDSNNFDDIAWHWYHYGERIEKPDFIRTSGPFLDGPYQPISFALYDFNNDGIPILIVNYAPAVARCGGFAGVYKFIGGEYRATETTLDSGLRKFLTDRNGRIVMFLNNERDEVFGYWYFTLHKNGVELEVIFAQPDEKFCWQTEHDAWAEHQRYEHRAWTEHHRYPYWYTNPTIFRMPEETLTRIPRLTELEEQLTANIRRTHGLD